MGMQLAPKLVLNESGMPWGRWVQSTLQGHDTTLSAVKNTAAAVQATQNSQIKRLAGQIQILQAQQATLAAQETQLAAQQAQIESVIQSLIATGSAGGSSTDFAFPTTSTQIASGTISVPSGYSTVTVINVCQIDAYNTSNSTYLYGSANINGTTGAESLTTISGPDAVSGSEAVSISPSAIRTFDVSAITAFTVGVNVRTGSAVAAYSGNTATFNAIAIFTNS